MQADDDDNNDEGPPLPDDGGGDGGDDELTFRILNNEPGMTHLNVRNASDFGIDIFELAEEDLEGARIVEEQGNRCIEALERNHTITSVNLDAWVGYVLEYSELFDRIVHALLRLANLEEIKLQHEHYFRSREIAVFLGEARNLRKLSLPDILFETEKEASDFVENLRNLSKLVSIEMGLWVGDRGRKASQMLGVVSSTLLKHLLTLSNLTELRLSHVLVNPSMIVSLVNLPSLRVLALRDAGLSDEHVIAIAKALLKQNGHLEYVDFSGSPLRRQEAWDALFRLVTHDNLIRVRATALYVHPQVPRTSVPGRPSSSRRVSRPDRYTFHLRYRDAVNQHLLNQEVARSNWLRDAGFEKLLAAKETLKVEAAMEAMAKPMIKNDSIALFHILRAFPILCDRNKSRSTKRKHAG